MLNPRSTVRVQRVTGQWYAAFHGELERRCTLSNTAFSPPSLNTPISGESSGEEFAGTHSFKDSFYDRTS